MSAPAPRLQDILLLVGQLNYTWTNTESLLIYLIAGLAKVDKETAIVVFLTLNTTRARIDLVERLAKMSATSAPCRKDVLAITDQLLKQGKLRNKYSHCIYSFDETGSRASTQLMRIFDAKDSIKYGKVDPLDGAEMRNIAASIEAIRQLNEAIMSIVTRYRFPH
ncbi:hypothetical protein [Aureimonas sp. ME7]|uniref:hypothetical protein n=1 Tax=Aureimonas sp. ME7 TaxID=2744252 RepID=UPI0015F36290|nr:hypothetical protein [Aureimonas sp. ME7]